MARFLSVLLSAVLLLGGATPLRSPAVAAPPSGMRVVAISVDALNPDALTALGRAKLPNFHRLIDEGATTLNARTQMEMTVTLPNHTSMVTGVPISRAYNGHGVTFNNENRSMTVTKTARRQIDSIFSRVKARGGSSAVFAGKTKFRLWQRTWPRAITRTVVDTNTPRLTGAAIKELTTTSRDLVFLHFGDPDYNAHLYGGMSSRYLAALQATDRQIGRVLAALDARPALKAKTMIVLTADHGIKPGSASHGDATDITNFRVPFMIWGPGVTAGADLYKLNPEYRDPRRARAGYGSPKPPIRNGDLANVVADILNTASVVRSRYDAKQVLDWNSPGDLGYDPPRLPRRN
jgi:predicted AlkP superfamily pyrophosphatase or phosphodiesterase